MPLLQRFIFKELLQTFVLCSIVLLSLAILSRVSYLREVFLGLDLQFFDLIKLFFFLIPSFLFILMPICCMLSVFLTFLRLNTDRELIALKAGGVSIYQLILAPAIFSLLCMAFTFYISFHGIAWGMTSFRTLVLEVASTRAKVVVQPGVFNQDFIKGLTIYSRNVDPVTGNLSHVIFEDNRQDNSDNSLTIIASEGNITTDEEHGQLVFTLSNGHIYRIDKNTLSTLNFDNYIINIDLSKIFTTSTFEVVKPKSMEWNTLKKISKGLGGTSSVAQIKALVEIQKRLSLPVSCLILGLLAIPLACFFEGVKRQFGIVISLGMFLLYYGFFSLGMSLGESGKISPAIALWSANALFSLLTCLSFYFIRNEKTFSLYQITRFFTSSAKKL